jgi:hypothetical protein
MESPGSDARRGSLSLVVLSESVNKEAHTQRAGYDGMRENMVPD